MQTRRVAYAVILTAIAVAGGLLSIPVGLAKVSPAQAMVNVLAAVLLGPWYAVGVAFAASVIRNAAGTGTLFAFPGSMIGAFLAGFAYRFTHNVYLAALGEIIGTGILAALASAYLVAPAFMNKPADLFLIGASFLLSTLVGSVIGVLGIQVLQRAGIVKPPRTAVPARHGDSAV